jgi:hypothetical protein
MIIHVENDVKTNAAFLNGPRAMCFQGTNILVKDDGTDNVTKGECLRPFGLQVLSFFNG